MKNILSALFKIVVLVVIFFIVNAIAGILLPLSHDMIAPLSVAEKALFMPLYLLYIFIAMSALFITLKCLRYKSLRLYLAVFISFIGLFSVLNQVEILWYIEAFPLFTSLDVVKMFLTDVFAYGITALVGVWLVKGFKKEKEVKSTVFDMGRSSWKVAVFVVLYPLFYYCCGFIAWSFPAAREFYSGWAATSEPISILLLFNVFRGGLWLFFSLPLLLGARTRKQAFRLLPFILVIATAGGLIMPNAAMPAMVRLAHGIELTFSMTIVGIFMVWLFLKEKKS
jgi:hypothetical protein